LQDDTFGGTAVAECSTSALDTHDPKRTTAWMWCIPSRCTLETIQVTDTFYSPSFTFLHGLWPVVQQHHIDAGGPGQFPPACAAPAEHTAQPPNEQTPCWLAETLPTQ